MVSRSHPKGVSYAEFERPTAANHASRARWQRVIRNPITHVRGEIRHRDHKTIHLDRWHRVHMNRGRFARNAPQIAFLD